MAFRFATVLSESGTEGNGGGLDVAVAVVDVVLLDPVKPTEALVAPPLVSQGFGGEGVDMCSRVPPHRALVRTSVVISSRCRNGCRCR